MHSAKLTWAPEIIIWKLIFFVPLKLLGMFVVHAIICLDVLVYFPSGFLVRLDRISGTMVHGDNYQS